jgi:NitT/TauT family transport system substrate-binding protein
MAAAKAFGEASAQKLDPSTISMAHPDATSTMLGGHTEIVANFSSAPFQYRQLKNPEIHKLFSSDEIVGGPYSFNVVAATNRFRTANPKLYGVFLASLDEATDFINRDKPAAAEAYGRISGDKTPKDEILAIMNQPDVRFTTELVNLGVFTDFMAKLGTLKNPPQDWKTEMVFPEAKIR